MKGYPTKKAGACGQVLIAEMVVVVEHCESSTFSDHSRKRRGAQGLVGIYSTG